MKHIKIKIVFTIWLSAFLLFLVCEIILNWSVPRHLKKEAVKSIESQLTFARELNDFMKNEDTYSDAFPEEPDEYFSGEIRFFPIKQLTNEKDESKSEEADGEINVDSQPTLTVTPAPDRNTELRELTDYIEAASPQPDTVLTLATKNGKYIFSTYIEYFPDDGEYLYVMYINLRHILAYTGTLNYILLFFFVTVSCIMSVPGYYLAKKIRESQETQRRFFQNSSHELKTPLMTVQGYAEGIQTGVTDPKDAADVILQESDRMTHLVNELLSLSKIDLHSLKPETARIDLKEVLYDSFRATEQLVERKGTELIPVLPDEPVWINADEDMLEHVFTNILSNAIRHCKTEVRVVCTAYSRFVTVKVRDDGDGIDEKDLPHVFERFYTGKNGSTGIGLALSQELVKLNGGTITAYNDNGAVFAVKFFYS